jgi:diadenosine tetraphosphate (Ap4A) HIT family hydrolase
MRAARALERVFQPVKMNFLMLGNAIPHLHCHLIPRFYGDAAPGRPLLPDDLDEVRLSLEEYEQRASLIRAAL